ncbi:hypothetical protein MASR1M32_25270 [Rhodobacter sp.]
MVLPEVSAIAKPLAFWTSKAGDSWKAGPCQKAAVAVDNFARYGIPDMRPGCLRQPEDRHRRPAGNPCSVPGEDVTEEGAGQQAKDDGADAEQPVDVQIHHEADAGKGALDELHDRLRWSLGAV